MFEVRNICKIWIHSSQFCCESKTSLKKLSLLKRKPIQLQKEERYWFLMISLSHYPAGYPSSRLPICRTIYSTMYFNLRQVFMFKRKYLRYVSEFPIKADDCGMVMELRLKFWFTYFKMCDLEKIIQLILLLVLLSIKG
jgi:hypothetical protein